MIRLVQGGCCWSAILAGLLLLQWLDCLAAARQDEQPATSGSSLAAFKSASIEYEHFFNHGTTANPKMSGHHHKFNKDQLMGSGGKLENEVLKSKVEVLGEVLKQRVQALRHVPGQKVELVFLVDSSASVGAENFFNELKFVKKLLADFTVSADAARVAVVTFSSKNRVVRHIDHVSRLGLSGHRELSADGGGDPRHKCRLLEQELPAIGYTGGGTYTLGALLEAQSVLEEARSEAVKAVFLITDGYSNGGDPRPAAKRLREQGVRIFTFGIRNGNVKELYDMASEPAQEHSYIVDSFEEFEALARRALHEDLQTGSYLPQGNRSACDRLCRDQSQCCHPSAECTCGTHTGHYACLCPPGHYGTGLKDDCHPCPGGTYRSDGGPGDLRSCRQCPDENHISPAGSTSESQCQCPRGYVPSEEDGGRTCQLLACPKLDPPANGYFVKQSCNSVFNGACGIRCNGGYKLIGSSIRLCQENGTWSGEEAACQMRSCGSVPPPKNGRIECTSDSYVIDSECTFSCDVGFTLVGSRKRVCLPIGYWDGLPAFCKPVFCNPLPKVMNGTWGPSKCPQAKIRYGEHCNATCATGFELRGPAVRRCSELGAWTEEEIKTRCVDVTPPEITCPADVTLDAEAGENFASYSWDHPVVSDNSGAVPDVISVPAVTEQPMRFRIGNATVAYKALDRRGNQAECSFQVTVLDGQPPTVDQCESPPTFLLRDRKAIVVWDEPVFSDNSGRPTTVERSHDPGRFPLGETQVVYTATDESGNSKTCTIVIRVQEHACHLPIDPIHGQANCSQQPDAVYCSLTCHDGYAFAMPPPRNYFCAYDGQWLPADSPLPFPDCSVTTHSDALIQDGLLRLTNVGQGSEEEKICQDPFLMSQMEGHFKRRLAARLNEICGDNMICQVDDLQAECRQVVAESDDDPSMLPDEDGHNSVDWEETNEITRSRRSVTAGRRYQRHSVDWSQIIRRMKRNASSNSTKSKADKSKKNSGLTLELRFKVLSRFPKKSNGTTDEISTTTTSRTTSPTFSQLTPEVMLNELNQLRALLTESALSGEFNVNYTAGQLLNVFDVQFQGDVERPKFSCPAGSVPIKASNDNNNNNNNNSTTSNHDFARCVYCPIGTFFNVVNEVCESCSQGSYQPEEGQLSCLVCPHNTSTKVVNAKRSDDCQAQCLAGSYSPTGLEPCSTCPQGTYQTEYSQRNCLPCPSGSTTWRRGARRLDDCKSVCPRGLVSETGLAPCFSCPVGFYQPLNGQRFCIRCPRRSPYTAAIGAVNRMECLRTRPITDDNYVNGTDEFPEPEATEEFEEMTLLEVNECFSLPCQNGGQCRTLDFGYVCDCPAGYTGMQCQTDVDDCASLPCLNGATCVDAVNSYQCLCPAGFSGAQCQTDIDECLSGPCHQGATCLDKILGYVCVCPPGMAGSRCELEVDECLSGPCQNGGTCYDRVANYTCVCQPGWAGKLCEQAVDECLSQPCLNGATCEDLIGNFICHCPLGYDGPLCQTDVDECLPEPCAAGSTCVNRLGSFACLCPPGVVGSTCDTAVNSDFSLEFTSAGKLDYAVWEGGLRTDARPLRQMTMCAWIKTTDQQNYGTVFSYATDDEANSLTLTDYSGFVLYVNGAKVVTDVTANDGRWHLICATWNSPDGQWRIYSDGELKDKGFGLASNSSIHPNGTVILGQEQDVRAGGFSNAESFVGQLYGVELWDSVLDDQQIAGLTLSCHQPGQQQSSSQYRAGNLITWADFKHGLRGGIRVEESIFCRGCSDPIPPQHGRVKVEGNEAVYECELGYLLSTASPRRPCLVYGGWSGLDPECQRLSCGFPGYILNGLVNGTNFVYGNTVSYNCTRGFRLSGDGLRTCEENGQWSGYPPECVPVTCEPPIPPVNGSQIEPPVSQEFYAVGDRITFQCSTGFRLDGPYSLACQDEGQWDDVLPVCQPLACTRPPYVEHGIVTNGVAEILPEDLPHFLVPGSILTFTCLFGYQLESSAEVQCSHEGFWIGQIPKCVPIQCGTPPEIDHATAQLSRPDNDRVGSVASYVCQSGFEHFGPAELECTESGTWLDRNKQATLPVCMPVDCGSPPTVDNGGVYAEEQTFGSKAAVTCYSGFKLMGASSSWIECGADNRWGVAPQCLPVACAQAPLVRNGTQSAAEPFVAGEELSFACQDGFRSTSSDLLVCLEDGSWSGNIPECLPEECPPPDAIDNGAWLYTSAVDGEMVNAQTVFYTGAEVVYSCNEGFLLEGGTRRRCAGTVGWMPQGLPKCRTLASIAGITCPALDNPDHGTIVVEGFETGQLATYECDTGFQAGATSGPATLVCNSDGTWSVSDAESNSNEPFRCQQVVCSEPETPANGSVTFTSSNFGSKALFRCDQGFVLSGSQQRTCGSEGEWIGGAKPKCVPRTCDMPDIIEHGYIGFEVGGSATSLGTGSVILYDCEEGYKLVGARERSCLPSGDWTDQEPSCHQIFCERLPSTMEHGTVTGAEENIYGSVVQFVCHPGYELDGPERLSCQDDENWSGIMPTCRPVECPNPGLVANIVVSLKQADVRLDPEVYHYGDVLVYTCRRGYGIVKSDNDSGVVERRCLADGSWSSKLPVCSRVSCPPAVIPQNGYTSRPVQNEVASSVNETAEEAAIVGQIIDYGCKKGYQLSDDSPKVAKCLETGKWNVSQTPTCQLIRCPQPPVVKNGKLDGNGKKEYSYLDSVKYECDFGFRMTGQDRVGCTFSGDWEDQIPTCVRAICLSVDILEDGIITPVYPPSDGQKTGRQQRPMALKFSCQDGYDLVGSALTECTSTGEWNHPFPACVPWPCESPPIPPNSQIQSTVIRPDIITAIVRCDPGFRLLGSNLTCGPAGIWKGKAECEAQLCPLPKQLSTGKAVIGDFKFTQPLKSSYGFGETIQFSCRLGYVLQDPQMSALTCADDGQWDEQKIPVCQPIRCPDVQVPKHGTVSGTSSILDSRITFSCQEGYQLNGEEQITCRPDGTWSHPAMPVCVTRSCGDPPNIDNGFAVVRGTGVGDTISYSCQTGHRLSGVESRTCLSNGRWSGEDPACDPVVCAVPEAPEHGSWTVGGFVPGSTIRFECKPGFTLVGSATVTCLTDKSWSDRPPSCQQITCPPLRDPEHGTVQLTNWISDNQELNNDINQQLAVGYHSTAHYACNRGYQLFGPGQRTCTDQGTWSDRGPQCQRVWCPEPQAPLQGFVMGTGRQYGDRVRYACSTGYRLIGADDSTCQADGTWSTVSPQCEALTCFAPPPAVSHTIAPASGKPITTGTQMILRCQEGFTPVGDMTLQCLHNQQWSTVKGHCKRVHCSHPVAKGTASVVVISGEADAGSGQYHFGDRLLVSCKHGRHLKGSSAILVCQADGQWTGQPPVCESQCDTVCLNGGSCNSNNRKCTCQPGYSGDRCQHAHCILPCLHGGTCIAPYRCACRPGRTGERCQTPVCDQPCLNGGRCVSPNVCTCPHGTVGPSCRKRSDIFSSRG